MRFLSWNGCEFGLHASVALGQAGTDMEAAGEAADTRMDVTATGAPAGMTGAGEDGA